MNMIDFKKIGLFLLANSLGFLSISVNFLIAIQMGVFNNTAGEDVLALRNAFFHNTSMIWIVCCIFSFAYFLLNGRAAHAFLWSALYVPLLYGISILHF